MTRKKQKTVSPPAPSAVRGEDPLLPSGAAGLSEAAALLAWSAPVVPAPSAKVKAQLLARIRDSKLKTVKPVPEGWRFLSASVAEGWRETFPGVRFKTLSVDDERDVVMLLVEMQPGSRFPDHPHDVSADEGVVITGDVDMDGHLMKPGDYYYAGLGTMHTNVTSPSGCTALLSLRASAWHRWRTAMASR